MPSQGSQQLSSSPLCLSLLKFSYATVFNESIAPIPWIHLSSKNSLFAVFETSPVQLDNGRVEERQRFKVLRDPEVMEELDLDALSAGAHRAMAQAPNLMSPRIPEVTVIVKVPMIAMKYPMPNGQIRRFQIRFTTNEDYYEAMKMLSRAKIPTVEAGSFPQQRSQAAPRPTTSNYLAPSDSASQIGFPSELGASATNSRAEHVTPASANYSISSFRPQPASVVHSAMAPPKYFPAPADTNTHGQPLQPVVPGQLSVHQTVGSRSNISLSTATTLVAAANNSDAHGLHARSENTTPALIPRNPHVVRQDFGFDQPPQSVPTRELDKEAGLGLPPKRELPFRKVVDNGPYEQQESLRETNNECKSVASTVASGKRKRGATQKPTKPPAAKKPRATTTRRKAGGNSAKDNTPVPTIEELLQQQGDYSQPRTTQVANNTLAADLEPRSRVKIPQPMEVPDSDACSPMPQPSSDGPTVSPTFGGITRRITRAASKSLACVPVPAAPVTRSKAIAKKSIPCTPADQIVIPSTPDSPAAGRSKSPGKAPPRPRRRATAHGSTRCDQSRETPLDSAEAGQTDPSGLFTCADPASPAPSSRSAPEAAPDQRTPGNVQDCLEADPRFAQGSQKLHAWSNLPSAKRVPALRSYFCQLIMDPGFPALCKTLNSFWEKEILERRIEQATGLEDGGGGGVVTDGE